MQLLLYNNTLNGVLSGQLCIRLHLVYLHIQHHFHVWASAARLMFTQQVMSVVVSVLARSWGQV